MDRTNISVLEFVPMSFLEEHDTFECVQDEIDYMWSTGKKPDAADLAQCFAEDWVYRTDPFKQREYMKMPFSEVIFYGNADKDHIMIAIDYLFCMIKDLEQRMSKMNDQDRQKVEHLRRGLEMAVGILTKEWKKL